MTAATPSRNPAGPSPAPSPAGVSAVLPGLLLTVVLATAGFWLADRPWVKDTLHVSALLLVILLGMAWK